MNILPECLSRSPFSLETQRKLTKYQMSSINPIAAALELQKQIAVQHATNLATLNSLESSVSALSSLLDLAPSVVQQQLINARKEVQSLNAVVGLWQNGMAVVMAKWRER